MYAMTSGMFPNGDLTLHVHPGAFTVNASATEDVLLSLAEDDELTCLRLDCECVTKLDSRALRCLVEVKRRLVERGAELLLFNVPITIVRFLEHLRLAEYLLDPGTYSSEAADKLVQSTAETTARPIH